MTVSHRRSHPDAGPRPRALVATFCGLILAAILPFAGSTPTLAASPSADGEILAGRLGGSFDSFVRRFGDATAVSGSYGEIFAVEGFGVAGVQFDRRVAVRPDPGDPALLVLLGAPRASLAATRDPDPADWPIAVATSRARDFLPTDVGLGAPTAQDAHTLVAECRSAALERVFGVLSLGGCRVVYVTPTATTVSFIALTLTGGAATAGGSAPGDASGTGETECRGVAAWSRDSGRRLGQAAALLDRVGGTPDSDPGAVASLRDIARRLATLADDQRMAPTPAAAAKANFFIIAGLSGYSAAVDRAAAGVEGADAAAVDAAVGGIADANSSIAKGTAQLESAVGACGLAIATPVATP